MEKSCLEQLESFIQMILGFDSLRKELQITVITYGLMMHCKMHPFTALEVHDAMKALRFPIDIYQINNVFADKEFFLLSPPGYVFTRRGERKVSEIIEKIDKAREKGQENDNTRPSKSDAVVPLSVIQNTRSYIENTVYQINGCYESGWYDACAVMMRRLMENLLIEALIAKGAEADIKTQDGDYVPLDRLIGVATSGRLDLSRDTKRELTSAKSLGDKSAHSRRFCARRSDVDKLNLHYRAAVEELIAILRE